MDKHRDPKRKPVDARDPNDQPDPLEGRPDASDEYPRRNTEENRERKPGTMTRDEIRTRTHRNKTH